MFLSIIIPTLNEEKYLPRLLDSIKGQDFSDYEIIVSDGGSIDKTEIIAAKYGVAFISDKEHRHPSWQRNNGAAIAKGEVLLFLDADAELTSGFLKSAVNEFKEKALVVAGFYIEFSPNRPSYSLYASVFNCFCRLRQYLAPAAVGSGIMSRRSAHEAVKGFDTEIYVAEDFDYCYRLSRTGVFRMINSVRLKHSSRRLEKEGVPKTLGKWFLMALFTMFNLRIKKKIIKYEFGKY